MTKVLYLYDEITPVLAKDFVAQMAKLRADEPVTIAVNSPGGNVMAGDAIAAAIDRHAGRTTARVDGIAASAASFIAMFCDRVVMAAGAHIMVHCPYASMVGSADDLTAAAEVLRAIEVRYVATYATRTGLSEAEIRRMLVAETWLAAGRAVELGFADEVDRELVTARSVAKAVLKLAHVPAAVAGMANGEAAQGDARRDRQLQRRREALRAQLRQMQRQTMQDQLAARDVRARQDARAAMRKLAARVRIDDACRDAAERAETRRRLALDYYFDATRTPREQRRYD